MGSLFGGAPASSPAPVAPAPAVVEKPVVMPIKDDVTDRQYQQKQIAIKRGKGTNRANTIIGSEDTLGDG